MFWAHSVSALPVFAPEEQLLEQAARKVVSQEQRQLPPCSVKLKIKTHHRFHADSLLPRWVPHDRPLMSIGENMRGRSLGHVISHCGTYFCLGRTIPCATLITPSIA